MVLQEIVRIAHEAQEALTNTARHYEQIGQDLESHILQLTNEKSGLTLVVKRLQRENLALQRENQLLKYTSGIPSIESKVIELQEERDRYKKDYQRLLEDFDGLKIRREKELAAVLKICTVLERRIADIKGSATDT